MLWPTYGYSEVQNPHFTYRFIGNGVKVENTLPSLSTTPTGHIDTMVLSHPKAQRIAFFHIYAHNHVI